MHPVAERSRSRLATTAQSHRSPLALDETSLRVNQRERAAEQEGAIAVGRDQHGVLGGHRDFGFPMAAFLKHSGHAGRCTTPDDSTFSELTRG